MTTTRSLLLVALAGVLILAPARAGNLDRALLTQTGTAATKDGTRTVVKLGHALSQLGERGYRNVGVLPFRVQKGKGKPTFVAAPLATALPGRLEAAMVMMLGDEAGALGVIRDAAGTARREKVGAWRSQPAAYHKLFATTYRLAWGDKAVKAHAFLTGTITCADGQRTTVALDVIDRASLKGGVLTPRRLTTFTVENDRALLRDLGFGYVLPPSATARGSTSASRDKAAREAVARSLKAAARQGNAVTPDNIGGMQFGLLYNGQKQALKATDGDSRELFAAPPMPAGAKVAMTLKRVGDDERALGVVIKVNGRSTWDKEEGPSLSCTKWIYSRQKKGARHTYEGFYMGGSGAELLEFDVLSEAATAEKVSELGERAGWIDVDVFASGGAVVEAREDELTVTLRGLSRAERGQSPLTLKELQARLRRANNLAVGPGPVARERSGGLLWHKLEPRPSPPPTRSSFPNPVRLGGVTIRYYDKPRANGPIKVTPD